MRIETHRLVVRTPRVEDASALASIDADPLVQLYVAGQLATTPEEMTRRIGLRLQRERDLGLTVWTVEERACGRIVGTCGLIPAEGVGPEIELAYRFAPDVWGRGYATEAARACVRYGFEVVKLERIIAFCMEANAGSRRVLEKCGMRFTGMGVRHGTEVQEFEILPNETPASRLRAAAR